MTWGLHPRHLSAVQSPFPAIFSLLAVMLRRLPTALFSAVIGSAWLDSVFMIPGFLQVWNVAWCGELYLEGLLWCRSSGLLLFVNWQIFFCTSSPHSLSIGKVLGQASSSFHIHSFFKFFTKWTFLTKFCTFHCITSACAVIWRMTFGHNYTHRSKDEYLNGYRHIGEWLQTEELLYYTKQAFHTLQLHCILSMSESTPQNLICVTTWLFEHPAGQAAWCHVRPTLTRGIALRWWGSTRLRYPFVIWAYFPDGILKGIRVSSQMTTF